MPNPSIALATLDPNVLIAVEAGFPRATAAIKILLRLGYTPVLTPTVLAALGKMAANSENEAERAIAYRTAQHMGDSLYEIVPFNETAKVAVKKHAALLMERNVIPGGRMTDAKLLIEAAYKDGKMALVTTRAPILNADRGVLDLALGDCGLIEGSLKIFSPSALLEYGEATASFPTTDQP